jgi:hypothetical protein
MIFAKRLLLFTMLLGVIGIALGPTAGAEPIFYRMLAADSNAPFLPKTASVYRVDDSEGTGSTGMADTGFTEYPGVHGILDYTYRETYAFYPRIVSNVQADPNRINVGDILIDHVYDPDPVVWGPAGREFVQTFIATGRELVSITLLVATPRGVFRAALLEGGLDGEQVGPSKTFTSGHSMEWGSARWTAGQAPLVPGRTYAIKIWREDGERWSPYLHARGNCYDDGMLYIDGRALPNSDLGVTIVEETADITRALIEDADPDGWVYATDSFVFIPRSENIRLISVMARPVDGFCVDMVCRVYTTDDEPKLIAGPNRNLACGKSGGDRMGDFLFSVDALPVIPGEQYKVKISFAPHEEGKKLEESDEELRLDMRCRVYGEPHPGALPAFHNLTAEYPDATTLKLAWVMSYDAPTKVELWPAEWTHDLSAFDLEPGVTELAVPDLAVDTDYDFRMTATGPMGLEWRTPIYRVRIGGGTPETTLYDYPDTFVPVAPPIETKPWSPGVIRYRAEVPVANPGFEDGLEGWTVSDPDVISADGAGFGIEPPEGGKMAGWTHEAGEQREQVFQETEIHQRVPTEPGNTYLMSIRVHTSVANNFPRGDTRVRLFADPLGGDDFSDSNISQWFWTDGEWLTYYYQWTALAEQSTIGAGFFRWRDLDRASTYVDHVKVYDLGAAARTPRDPASLFETAPKVVVTGERTEADGLVGAALSAPPGYVITGLGASAEDGSITALWMKVQPVLPDGTLGEAEEMRAGAVMDAALGARLDLPNGYAATGFGARVEPDGDIATLALWGRPILPDRRLGDEKEFRAGSDANGSLANMVRIDAGRVIASAGIGADGLSATSNALVPTAVGMR